MDKKIIPHPSIIQSLISESETATPFSRIPGFIKKFAVIQNNQEKLVSILSSLGEKEISHLDTRIKNIHNNKNGFTSEFYQKIIEIESGTDQQGRNIHQKLIGLAKEIIASEMGDPVYQILKHVKAEIGTRTIDPSAFDNPHEDISAQFSDEEKSFIQQEQQVRTIVNALIMGAGHRIFDKVETDPKYPKTINRVHPELYQAYYDMVYTNFKYMRETQPLNGGGTNTGSMQLITEDSKAKIKVQADIFPVLLHETAKGVVEYLAYTRYNDLPANITSSILSVDSRESEHWMMLVGPQIYKQLFFLIKEAIAQYQEQHGLLDTKKESDYIIPIISHIIQLPAADFLSFIEKILRQDQDGIVSVSMIKNIIDAIHNQYELSRKNNTTPKTGLIIKDIVDELFVGWTSKDEETIAACKKYITTALPQVQLLLQGEGYKISDKTLAKKLAIHFKEYEEEYGFSNDINQTWITKLHDAISGFRSTRIEQVAFGQVHEQQKKFSKWTKNHQGDSINIQPRFPLSVLEEAKKTINSQGVEDIENQINELIQKGNISDWFKDHDNMHTTLSNLTERFITLDDTVPECLMQRDNNRGLYELINLEQLKRESQSMGGHCVADFVTSVKDGSLKVFSLRQGTQSHWTIGYQPGNKTITQVKGYTNKKKNSTLTLEDPDLEQVVEALNYIFTHFPVNKINDIDALSKNGFLLTNKGINSYNDIISAIRKGGIYDVTIFGDDLVLTVSYTDLDILQKINFKNIKMLRFEIGGAVIIYDVSSSNQKIQKWKDEYGIIDSEKLGNVVAALLSIKKDSFFERYDEYPYFGQHGLASDESLITKNGRCGMVKRDGDGFKEILPCNYESISKFLGEGIENEYIVKENGKFGFLKRIEDNFYEVLPIEYDDKPKFNDPGLSNDEALIKKGNKCGILKRENGTRKVILPCIYDRIPEFGIEGLAEDEAEVRKNGKYGIIRKEENGSFTQVLPCEYNTKITFFQDSQEGKGLPINDGQKCVVCRLPKFGTPLGNWDYGKILIENKVYFLQKNKDGTRDQTAYKEFEKISKEEERLAPDEYLVKERGKLGIVKKMSDGTRIQTLPCRYKEIERAIEQGLALDEYSVENEEWRHGIVKRLSNGTWIETLPCKYKGIEKVSPENLIVQEEYNGKNIPLKENSDGCREPVFVGDYDVVDFGTGGLKSNEAVIRYKGKLCIVINENGQDRIIENQEYLMKDFGKLGLRDGEARAKKVGGGIGIISRSDGEKIKEILPCIYDVVGGFGQPGLAEDEAFAVRDQKFGIIKKTKNGYKQVVQCKYYVIGGFGDDGLEDNYCWAQKEKDGEFVLLERKENGNIISCFSSYEKAILNFGSDWLLPNESFMDRTYSGYSYGLIRKTASGYKVIFDREYSFDTISIDNIKKQKNMDTNKAEKIVNERQIENRKGLLPNELKIHNDNFGDKIIRRNSDGNFQEISDRYEYIDFSNEDKNLKENEAKVYDGRYYGIIQRNNDGIFQEIIPCKFHSDMFYPPIKFCPGLIDDKRVVVCIEEYSDNIFLENNDGGFDLIKESKTFLQENPKVAVFVQKIYYGDADFSEEENEEELSIEEQITSTDQEVDKEVEDQEGLLISYDDQANEELAQNELLNQYFEDMEQYAKEKPFG